MNKIKSNFVVGNQGDLLVLLESAQWVVFYGGNFISFRPRMLRILNFE
jgi:hypothetical protein